MRTYYSRTLRSISAVTLAFFSWTFLSLWEIPAAIAAEKQKTAARGQSSRNPVKREQRSEEKFEGVLEAIREKVDKASGKADRGEDDTSEREAIKAKKAEIEAIDLELRKEFDATEQRLKAAKLPKEILARHTAFVEHYTSNINSLRKEIDDIDAAKTTTDRKAKIEKVRLHLEKVKAPSRHQKLDPENLPFKARKTTKTREPRTKEQFEKDFPKQKHHGIKTAANPQDFLSADFRSWAQISSVIGSQSTIANPKSAIEPKPILLAYNGELSDLPFSSASPAVSDFLPQLAFSDAAPLILAQAAIQPAPDDLSETPEVQFTPAIRAKAQELGGSPVRIYEWVRSNIEYAPTYGSISGADQCLQSRICNDMDTASLLIALLRVSGIYAHYVYSTIEVPIDKAMNLVGGVTNPNMVATIFATNGVPVRNVISGGTIKAVQIERVTVSAFIDYIPSRGAVHRQGNTWIPLDASYKSYTYTQGIDIASAVPFDAQTFANQIQSSATISTDGSVTNVNSLLVQQTMQNYQTRVQSYIQQNYPSATVGDVVGKKEILQMNSPILPCTLPYKATQVGSEFATVPDNLRETMSFNIPDSSGTTAGLTYSTGMPQIAGKKITLSYDPATVNDVNLLNTYGGDITKVPPYLLNLRPVINVEGNIVATGSQIQSGISHDFVVTFYEPGIGTDRVQNVLDAGGYNAIVLEPQSYSYNTFEKNVIKFKSTLEAMKAQLDTGAQPSVKRDNLIGDWLWLQGLYYFYAQGKMLGMTGWFNGVTFSKGVSMAITSAVPSVSHIFSIPNSFDLKGYGIDVDRNIFTAFSKIGDQEKIKQFMKMAGYISSTLEHKHVEALSKTPAMSTISLLNAANKAGIPIYTITKDNVTTVLPKLQVSSDVIDDISNAVGAGKEVTVQAREVSYYGNMGIGYIIQDPSTGAGAYKISGGANGGFQALLYCLKDILLTLYGLPTAKSITSVDGTFLIAMLNWAQYSLDNALSMDWSSDPISDPTVGYYFGLMLASLIVTAVIVALVLSGALIAALIFGIVAGILLNYGLMKVTAMKNGKPTPPFWCALPCGPVLVDAYKFWFTDDFYNFVNPCY